MKLISKNHFRDITKLQQKKYRSQSKNSLIEGLRLIQQVIKNGGEVISLLVSESADKEINKFASEQAGIPKYILKQHQIEKICSTVTPQSIAAVVRYKDIACARPRFILYLDNIKDPGNLGTIIRTASAASVSMCVLSPDCCEAFSPKAIRASMGTVFSIPISTRDYTWLANEEYELVVTHLEQAKSIFSWEKSAQTPVLVIGSEAFGVSKEILEMASERYYIPTSEKVESLNAAVAAGIAMIVMAQKAQFISS